MAANEPEKKARAPKRKRPPADKRFLYGETAAKEHIKRAIGEVRHQHRMSPEEITTLMGRLDTEYKNLFYDKKRRGVSFAEVIGLCYALDIDPEVFFNVDYSQPLRPNGS